MSICDEDSILVMMSCLSKGVGGGKPGSGNHDVRECSSPSPGTPWQSLNPYLLKHILIFLTLWALKCLQLSEKILGWYKRNSRDPNLFLRCCHEKLASYHVTIVPRICCYLAVQIKLDPWAKSGYLRPVWNTLDHFESEILVSQNSVSNFCWDALYNQNVEYTKYW